MPSTRPGCNHSSSTRVHQSGVSRPQARRKAPNHLLDRRAPAPPPQGSSAFPSAIKAGIGHDDTLKSEPPEPEPRDGRLHGDMFEGRYFCVRLPPI